MAKFAAVFPGQGSQSVGMLADLTTTESVVLDVFAEASEALGYNLWDKVQSGPDEALNQTVVTQPAMLTAGYAVWKAWQAKNGGTPAFVAGHSLGEYTALCAAGVINFVDAVTLVETRAKLMQEAVPAGEGAMAAVLGLEDAQIIECCEKAAEGDVVEAVNFNAPGQVVIAGSKSAVERAIQVCSDAGAKRALPLPVSVPSHCALMKPAADKLAEAMNAIAFSAPSIPVVQNVDGQVAADLEALKQKLIDQLYSPVKWVDSVNTMLADGVENVVEMGPGKVLAGLNKRIARKVPVSPVFDTDSLTKAIGE